MSAAILYLAVYVCEVMKQAVRYGTRIRYVMSLVYLFACFAFVFALFLLFMGKEEPTWPRPEKFKNEAER